MNAPFEIAPELQISHWLNTPAPISLSQLRGRVVVLHAFQMLCPACVAHGLPQATLLRETFSESDVAVIGLHTVFEHHAVMSADALRAFVHEYRLSFPIGIDMPAERGGIPRTMGAYKLRGTPSLVLIDREGVVRLTHFGHLDDMRLGALIGQLLTQTEGHSTTLRRTPMKTAATCDVDGCKTDGAS
jgi:peroxiredoxin